MMKMLAKEEIESFWKLGAMVASGTVEQGSSAYETYEVLKSKMIKEAVIKEPEEMPVDVALRAIVQCLNDHFAILKCAVQEKTLPQNEYDEKSSMVREAIDVLKKKLIV